MPAAPLSANVTGRDPAMVSEVASLIAVRIALSIGVDGVGGHCPGHPLGLHVGEVTGDEHDGEGSQQGDHHDHARGHPPALGTLLHTHASSTAALSARRFPFARNGTPILAARALSSTFW